MAAVMDDDNYDVSITWYIDAVLVEDNEGNKRWFHKDNSDEHFLQRFLNLYKGGQRPEECIDVLRVKDVSQRLLAQTQADNPDNLDNQL